MARFCDEKAKEFGELEVESPVITGGEEGGVGRELADRVAKEGGDCCVPKKKKEGGQI
jgi:4a-hydroxytetrahydrobiopterin dehydratase